ncbi:unnamed protein product [marine sediment metagenome]|uniref:Uncharacterized protein n=1 Tax=marine sediment metagenome TaxID=412755 RepID=X1F9P7_9ZZZZ
MENRIYPILYPADIGATRGSGPLRWISQHLIEPKTDRIHFFIIGDYLPWDKDHVILESIGKGIAVGRLSFYKPEDVEIYRVVLSETPEQRLGNRKVEEIHEVRRRAAAELTRFGRARYDYILIAQIALGALTLLLRGKLPPWRPEQFPYGKNKDYKRTLRKKLAIGNKFLKSSRHGMSPGRMT